VDRLPIFQIFGMTLQGIELQSPVLIANTNNLPVGIFTLV